jgi:iron complex outermembrane recepter protein
MNHPRFPIAPIALATFLALGTLVTTSAVAQTSQPASAEAVHTINLPAQALGSALNELARQTRMQLLVQRQLVEGKQAPAVSGSLTVPQAMQRLLAGSGLEPSFDGSSVVIKAAVAAAPQGEVDLPAVTVTATTEQPLAVRQEYGFRARSSAVSGFREQEVLNTPFSTATISSEIIADQQAKSLADVIKNDPSITLADDPLWYERVNVRGFYLSTDAVYRDGMSINDQGSIALENKAAVEVNKGLSALRYGATSPGGTLNYVVKRPTAEPLRSITLSANGDGGLGAHADLGGRFGSDAQFGYRINLAAEELRSHVKPFKGDKQFVSGFFDWQVNSQLSLELDLEHQRLKKLSVRGPSLWWWGWDEDAAAVAAAQAAFDRIGPQTYAYQRWAMEPNEQTYVVARAHYRINDAWKASFAAHRSKLWRDQNSSGVWDVVGPDGSYEDSIYYSPDQERNYSTYQLVVQGDVRQGSLRHELAFGHDRVQRDMTYPEGVYESIGFDNLFNPVGLPRPAVGPAEAGPSYLANRSRQQSWFLTDNLIINDQWRVFGGLRHTTIEQFGAGSATDALARRYKRSKTNPTMGVVFKPTPQGSVYLSYAEGIEQGGVVNGSNYTNNREQLPPLTSQQIEAGVKWEIGRDAMVTAALFQIDKGLEIDRGNSDGTRTRVQDGRQVHRGLEVTASGQLTPNLRVLAGIAQLDAVVTKTHNTALIGKKPQGVPDWQANLYADYALGGWMPGLSVNGGVYYGGKKAIDADNLWFADSYIRLDAGVKYTHRLSGGQQATYRLNIDNLADKRYLANTTWGSLQFGAPRTVRVSASFDF